MKNKGNMMVVWVLIVLIVVAFLVFITINKKSEMSEENNVASEEMNSGVKAGDIISVNYTGKLADGTVFDSNIDPKFSYVDPQTGEEMHYLVPLVFPVGVGQMIPGFDKGVIGMKVGDKKTLVISPEEGYGAEGRPPVIPPNATLTFDIELLGITQSE